jgi:glycosyltransferase involved in cell wall biosynthesis
MRILILHNLLWSQYKSVIFEKIAQTCSPSDELLVVQTAITEKGREDLVDFDVHHFPYQYPFKLLNQIPLQNVSQFQTARHWIKTIRQFKPDVINLTGYNELGTIPVMLLSKLMGIKTILTIESVQHQSGRFASIKLLYKKLVYQLCDGIFSYGLNTNRFLFEQGVPKQKILSYLNAFDQEKFQASEAKKPQAKPYLLYVGRISPEKNLASLIQLMKELDWDLKIVGDGPQRDFLAKNSGPNIEFMGSIAWKKLPDIYQGAACLILPSIYEPWGMVANEAQAFGKAVICTEACGCANDLIIDGYNGLVVRDILQDKARIKAFLDDLPDNQDTYTQRAKRMNQIFSVDRLSQEQWTGMKSVLNQ